MYHTSTDLKQLIARYASCPVERVERDLSGKKYTVTRHFTGEKSVARIVSELATESANREAEEVKY